MLIRILFVNKHLEGVGFKVLESNTT